METVIDSEAVLSLAQEIDNGEVSLHIDVLARLVAERMEASAEAVRRVLAQTGQYELAPAEMPESEGAA